MTGLALALLLAGPAAAAPAAAPPELARAEPARPTARLGEPFDYTIALRHAPGETVALAPLPDLAPFALRDASCHTTPGAGSAVSVCTLSLQLLDLGERRVPDLELVVTGPGGERRVRAPGEPVKGIGVTDARVPASSIALQPPAAPPVLVPSWRALGIAGGLLAALLGAWLLWRWWRRRREEPAAPLVLPPHERFSRQVGEILAAGLPERGRGREQVARLAGAVREYLAAIAPQAALDLTTGELLEALQARPAGGVDAAALGAFLAAADQVKFARHEPTAEDCAAAGRYALALHQATRPPEPPSALNPGGKEAA